MFLTQYITPSPGMDPTQRRMMAIMMPIFMGFILLHYASGLALYWGTSNIINLALQLAINQSSMGKEMHAIAARRAAKRALAAARRSFRAAGKRPSNARGPAPPPCVFDPADAISPPYRLADILDPAKPRDFSPCINLAK